MLVDIHVHSNYSACSNLDPAEAVELARGCGLGGICFTDHESTRVSEVIAPGLYDDFLVVVGFEYATSQGDFLVFGMDLPQLGLSADRLLATAADHKAAVVAAHPQRKGRMQDYDLWRAGQVNLAEAMNGRNTQHEDAAGQAMIKSCGLCGVAGSDAHSTAEIGAYSTRFPFRLQSPEQFVHALRAGQGRAAGPAPCAQRAALLS